jgi:hypothetical protein
MLAAEKEIFQNNDKVILANFSRQQSEKEF